MILEEEERKCVERRKKMARKQKRGQKKTKGPPKHNNKNKKTRTTTYEGSSPAMAVEAFFLSGGEGKGRGNEKKEFFKRRSKESVRAFVERKRESSEGEKEREF